MKEDLVRKYAAQLGISGFRPKTARGWIECPCPLAPYVSGHNNGVDRSPSFAILCTEVGVSMYACQQCKHRGTFASLAFKLAAFTGNEEYRGLGRHIQELEINSTVENLGTWDELEEEDFANKHKTESGHSVGDPFAFPSALNYKRPLEYMRSRGLHPVVALRMNLRYDYAEDRLLFPVIDRNYECRGLSGRAMHKNPKLRVKDYFGLDKREVFLGEDDIFRGRSKFRFVIGVEGLIDRAATLQAKFRNSFALMGSALTPVKFQKLIDLDLPIIWMVDNDHAGDDFLYGPVNEETGEREGEKGVLKKLGPYVPQLVIDYPEWFDDPGSCTPEQIQELVKMARLHI